MTLNLLHPSIFPTFSSEEGLCCCSSTQFADGYALEDESLDACPNNIWKSNAELGDEKGTSDDSLYDDILAILPADPFGMDVTATFTAITGWIEDFENDWGSDSNGFETDHGFFPGLNMLWDMCQIDGYKKGLCPDRMALIFPALPSEEVLCSPNGCPPEEDPDNNLDISATSIWKFNAELGDSFDCMKEKDEKGTNDDSLSDDILALLPADPFGMDITSTFTAITGWIKDFEKDRVSDSDGFGTDGIEVKSSGHGFFSGLNMLCDMFQIDGYKKLFFIDKDIGVGSAPNTGACMSVNEDNNWPVFYQTKKFQDCAFMDSGVGAPHDALFFALGYLAVQDLLAAERVCRSLRNAVISDPLLWRNIHIDKPLSDRITDDILLQLTDRAQGTLQSLSLVWCFGITDSGLQRVFRSNLCLKKLSVPGCVRLSAEGILYNLKALKSSGAPGIKHLRIGGIFGVTEPHLEELKSLLGANNLMQIKSHKPRFYRFGQLDLSCDEDQAIDIETCPKCQEVRLVYDCPAESCQEENLPADSCRACTLCIPRCGHCGRCIDNCDYEEVFLLYSCCLNCREDALNHPEGLNGVLFPHLSSLFSITRRPVVFPF